MSMTMVTNTNMNMVIPAVGREFIAADKNKNQEMLHQTCVMLLMCSLADSNSLVETKFNQFLMLEILAEMPEEQLIHFKGCSITFLSASSLSSRF